MPGLRTPDPRHRVQVLFGEVQIAEYAAEPSLAARYAAAMERRFPGLRVTCTPIVAEDDTEDR